MIIVREMMEEDRGEWNRYVLSHPRSTPYHLFEWKYALEQAYHLQTHYLGAFEDGALIAVMPTAMIRRPMQKMFAVSLPYCSYAGILASGIANSEKFQSIFFSQLQSRGAAKLEIREMGDKSEPPTSECTLIRPLADNPDALWEQLDSNVRRKVRRASKEGMTVRWGLDQLDDFYSVYAHNMAFVGTPVHSRGFFEALATRGAEYVRIGTVRFDQQAVAAMFLFEFKNGLMDPWVASIRTYDRWYATMLLYWEAMKYGCERRCTQFDFGRSHRDSGTYRFKLQWGADPVPVLNYSLDANDTRTDATVELYRGFAGRLLSGMWRWLPYRMTLALGPLLRRYIP